MHRSLYDAFCHTASEHAGRTAWLCPQIHWAPSIQWCEARQSVDRLALWLQKNHIQAADRIVNLEPNSHRWAILDLACSAIGAIHSPIDPRWNDQYVLPALQSLEPRIIFTSASSKLPHTKTISIADALDQATDTPSKLQTENWQAQLRWDQTANILWTSGTTADPKGVMLSHANLLSNAMAKLDAMPQNAQDVRLNLLPFAHAYARTCELTTWYLSGGSIACVATSPELLKATSVVRPTLINAVPSVFEFLLRNFEANYPHASLGSMLGGRIRQLASGGAAIDPKIRTRFTSESMPIYQGYGLTEASPVVCSNRAPRIQHGQRIEAIFHGVGSPVLNVQHRIDDQDRLWVKSPGVMQGYWRNEQATDEKIKDGWLDTGDCASEVHDNSTTLHIAGRADEVQVLSTGHKFAPCILEQTIAKLDGIADCVVVGTGLRRPLVIVQLKDSYPADDLAVLEQIHRGLGPQPDYLQVAQVVFADEPWTVENGLRHWKGGINRREIIRRLTPK